MPDTEAAEKKKLWFCFYRESKTAGTSDKGQTTSTDNFGRNGQWRKKEKQPGIKFRK